METLVSIIIPTHNAEKHISKCLTSISNQNYSCTEVVIVDYKSTDNTPNLAKKSSTNVRFIACETKGVYAAMNLGIEQAKGEWLLFLGADDELDDTDVLSQIFTSTPKAEVVLAKVKNVNVSSKKVPEFYQNKWSKQMYWRNNIHHQGVFYHKSVFERYSFDESFDILADYKLHLQLLQDDISTRYKNIILVKSNASGLSKRFTSKLYKEELQLKKTVLPIWAYLLNCLWVPLKFLYKSI